MNRVASAVGEGWQGGQFGTSTFRGRGPKGYNRSDERIREEVSDRLMEHDEIDASEIEVEVSSGEVTLKGTVQDRRVKYLAEELVESIMGVKDVTNQLRVRRESGESSRTSGQESRGTSSSGTQERSGQRTGSRVTAGAGT